MDGLRKGNQLFVRRKSCEGFLISEHRDRTFVAGLMIFSRWESASSLLELRQSHHFLSLTLIEEKASIHRISNLSPL